MQIGRILAPVDFSDLSALALRYAGLLAGCGTARITVAYAHSFLPPPYFTEGRLEELNRQFRESFAEAEGALRGFAQTHLGTAAAAAAEYRVVDASPARAIHEAAVQSGADLVVMGTHGRSGVNRLMLGSVAERVLRESRVPVLTVRGDTAGPLDRPRHILCPVNDTPAARAALTAAATLARCFDATVTALHVSETGTSGGIPNLCAWVPQEVRSQCHVRELTLQGDPARETIAFARESGCDLLAIGAAHRRFFDATVLGATVARVVRHAPCPVLTVPGPAA